ncbi:MAG TPA: hypothetical protein PK959_06685 [Candidatus Competibacteraceae bacterium]|nr:hypothetical protein [Candidatus Competibacteraceae bacterium]
MDTLKRSLLIAVLLIATLSLGFQLWQGWQFFKAGPRFTAQDGQALCERVAALERHSIGFQQSGSISPPCRFVRKP